MATHTGLLQAVDGNTTAPLTVSMHIEDGRFRMWTGRRRIGSWDEDAVKVERHTIFRFRIHVEGEIYEFIPDDPTEFAAHMKVVVDLTDQVRPRFGLAARLRDTASEA